MLALSFWGCAEVNPSNLNGVDSGRRSFGQGSMEGLKTQRRPAQVRAIPHPAAASFLPLFVVLSKVWA